MGCNYGNCPKCGAAGKFRERRPFGDDTCENGHVYPSASAVLPPRPTPPPPPTKPQPALSAEMLGEEDRVLKRFLEASNQVSWMLSAFNAGHGGSPGQHERAITEFHNALHAANAAFDRLLNQREEEHAPKTN